MWAYIGSDLPEYEAYRRELDTVIPAFGLLGLVETGVETETGLGKAAAAVRLSVVS
jgi:hypothetical protein